MAELQNLDIDPKHPTENAAVNMDFTGALPSGVTLSTVTWTAPGLTVTSPTVSGAVASAYLAGGTDGQDYWITAEGALSSGATAVLEGRLRVRSNANRPR